MPKIQLLLGLIRKNMTAYETLKNTPVKNALNVPDNPISYKNYYS